MPAKTEIGLTQYLENPSEGSDEIASLLQQFEEQIANGRLSWSTSLRICEATGSGSQGSVFRAERIGADGFRMPVAVKYFSPEIFASADQYDGAMANLGAIASVIATIQHENLLVVNHFLNHDRIRVMVMEWIDGFDIRRMLTAKMYGCIEERCSRRRWQQLNEVLFSRGPVQPRLKAGAVAAITSDCLSALTSLHDEGVIHNDVKPSNVMLTRAGRAKIIDVGSASRVDQFEINRTCTPAYCAPEVLINGNSNDVTSDIASVGYLALEMLTGRPSYVEDQDLKSLLHHKQSLWHRIPELLTESLGRDTPWITVLQKMTAAEPDERYQSAEEAACELAELVHGKGSESAARDCIKIWIDELLDCG